MIKNLDASQNWVVYHREVPNTGALLLDDNAGITTATTYWNNTSPTATSFSLGTDNMMNGNGNNYIAYVFAGGESSASEAVSVDVAGGTDYMNTSATSDFAFGTGDFTIECWVKNDNTGNNGGFFNIDTGTGIGATDGIAAAWNGSVWLMYAGNAGGQYTAHSNFKMHEGLWYHVAYVRHSNTTTLYVNGTEVVSATDSTDYSANRALAVGVYAGTGYTFNGKISNLRVVKGTAVYTSSFNPPIEPLANISGTTMLCCNNSSTTGKTVGPALTATGTVVASTESPFDDPASQVFGESGKESIIKCGKITTDGTSGATLNLPWEPQWFLFKRSNGNSNWTLLDSIRGWTTDGTVANIYANLNSAESAGGGYEELKSRTIKFQGYGNGYDFVWMAIRRPDGYVGKPVEIATSVFGLTSGAGSSARPAFVPNFPVDFHVLRKKAESGQSWQSSSRLMGARTLHLNAKQEEAAHGDYVWEDVIGVAKDFDSSYTGWSWKRHAGFDVVTYVGTGIQGRDVPHNLGVAPEMMWVKNRTRTAGGGADWNVYVSGITHLSVYGSDPDSFGNNPVAFELNTTDKAGFSGSGYWDHTHPTSTHFRVGDTYTTNQSGEEMIAFLFSSVSNISKVGNYTGTGSSGLSITCGFSPRFIIIKRATVDDDWVLYDTLRGLGSGNDAQLKINSTGAETSDDKIDPTSTGFDIVTTNAMLNNSGDRYIFYAHA